MNSLTPEQAEKILGRIPYGDRITACRMLMPSGLHPEDMCSVEEVCWFLEPSARTLPGIDLPALARWIERHFGDKQTAATIKRIDREASSRAEACRMTWKLLVERLEEAREVLRG